jgi:hypothetical protein
MDSDQRAARLSREELGYLKAAGFLPESLVQRLSTVEAETGDANLVVVSRGIAEEIRSALTRRLAATGFDADYELNSEGRLLEALIDRFCSQDSDHDILE